MNRTVVLRNMLLWRLRSMGAATGFALNCMTPSEYSCGPSGREYCGLICDIGYRTKSLPDSRMHVAYLTRCATTGVVSNVAACAH